MALASIVGAVVFYVLIITAVGMASPWRESAQLPMATAAAVQHLLPKGMLSQAVLIAAILSLIKTWNGVALTASRLLLAQGREGLLPRVFGFTHRRFGSPYVAVMFIAILNIAGVALGRGAILPIVNTAAICVGAVYVMVCTAVLKLRHETPGTVGSFRVPGGRPVIAFALTLAVVMALYGLMEPFWTQDRSGGVPLQWIILAVWSAVGVLFWSVFASGSLSTRKQVADE
jgi:amino acid transporter